MSVRENQYVELKNQTIADTLYGHILTRDARDVSYLFSVYGNGEYGRLIPRWDADNSGFAVNQRPEDWR